MIVCVALQAPSGLVFSLPRPARHDTVMFLLGSCYIENEGKKASQIDLPTVVAGFLDDRGEFLTRRDAYIHALACGQLAEKDDGRAVLVSEDLW